MEMKGPDCWSGSLTSNNITKASYFQHVSSSCQFARVQVSIPFRYLNAMPQPFLNGVEVDTPIKGLSSESVLLKIFNLEVDFSFIKVTYDFFTLCAVKMYWKCQ